MQLHDLLVSLVAAGVHVESRVHVIECENGHQSGYAMVPNQGEPQAIAVQCSQCQAIGHIGRPLQSTKTTPQQPKPVSPKPVPVALTLEAAEKLSDEELDRQVRAAERKSPDYKILMKVRCSRNLSRARAVKAGRFLDERQVTTDRINAAWNEYAAKPVQDCEATLQALIAQNPYEHKVDIDPVVLFKASWLASELWNKDFVNELSTRWKFPVHLFRGRIESVWEWLDDSVRLKMPFMAQATKSPCKAAASLSKAAASKKAPETVAPQEEPTQKSA